MPQNCVFNKNCVRCKNVLDTESIHMSDLMERCIVCDVYLLFEKDKEAMKNAIQIKNLRNATPSAPNEVKVDRTSILGNRNWMENEGQRDAVCNHYITDFAFNSLHNGDFKKELARLVSLYKEYGSLTLYCWCAPKRCHAETIRDYIWEVCKND